MVVLGYAVEVGRLAPVDAPRTNIQEPLCTALDSEVKHISGASNDLVVTF